MLENLSAQYASLISSSSNKIPVSVILIDRAGCLVYASDGISARLGYSSKNLLMKNIRDIDPTFEFESYFTLSNEQSESESESSQSLGGASSSPPPADVAFLALGLV